jgi:hypothetical protein
MAQCVRQEAEREDFKKVTLLNWGTPPPSFAAL